MTSKSRAAPAPPRLPRSANIETRAAQLVLLASQFELEAAYDVADNGTSVDPWLRAAAAVLHVLTLAREHGLHRDLTKLETIAMRAIRRLSELKPPPPAFAPNASRPGAAETLRLCMLGHLSHANDGATLVADFVSDLSEWAEVVAPIATMLPSSYSKASRTGAVAGVDRLLRRAELTGDDRVPLAGAIVQEILRSFGYTKWKSLFDAERKRQKKK